MTKLLQLAILGLALATGAAQAAGEAKGGDAPPSDGRSAQQARMKGCNADAKAKALKGDERKSFMSDCLKKKA